MVFYGIDIENDENDDGDDDDKNDANTGSASIGPNTGSISNIWYENNIEEMDEEDIEDTFEINIDTLGNDQDTLVSWWFSNLYPSFLNVWWLWCYIFVCCFCCFVIFKMINDLEMNLKIKCNWFAKHM